MHKSKSMDSFRTLSTVKFIIYRNWQKYIKITQQTFILQTLQVQNKTIHIMQLPLQYPV